MADPDPLIITVDRRPVVYRVLMRRGDTFTEQYRLGTLPEPTELVPEPDPETDTEWWDLTGWEIAGTARAKANDTEPLGELITEIHATQSGDTQGLVTVELPSDVSALIPIGPGKLPVADVQLTAPDGTVITPIGYQFPFEPDVTRPA